MKIFSHPPPPKMITYIPQPQIRSPKNFFLDMKFYLDFICWKIDPLSHTHTQFVQGAAPQQPNFQNWFREESSRIKFCYGKFFKAIPYDTEFFRMIRNFFLKFSNFSRPKNFFCGIYFFFHVFLSFLKNSKYPILRAKLKRKMSMLQNVLEKKKQKKTLFFSVQFLGQKKKWLSMLQNVLVKKYW